MTDLTHSDVDDRDELFESSMGAEAKAETAADPSTGAAADALRIPHTAADESTVEANVVALPFDEGVADAVDEDDDSVDLFAEWEPPAPVRGPRARTFPPRAALGAAAVVLLLLAALAVARRGDAPATQPPSSRPSSTAGVGRAPHTAKRKVRRSRRREAPARHVAPRPSSRVPRFRVAPATAPAPRRAAPTRHVSAVSQFTNEFTP